MNRKNFESIFQVRGCKKYYLISIQVWMCLRYMYITTGQTILNNALVLSCFHAFMHSSFLNHTFFFTFLFPFFPFFPFFLFPFFSFVFSVFSYVFFYRVIILFYRFQDIFIIIWVLERERELLFSSLIFNYRLIKELQMTLKIRVGILTQKKANFSIIKM